jgi:hypothetical protein
MSDTATAPNPIKGEFPLKVGAETFRCVLDINALCVAEGMIGKSAGEFTPLIGGGDMNLLRTLLWVALQRFHGELTREDAGDMIGELSPTAVQAVLILGLARSFPKADQKGAAGGGNPRPRPARGAAKA